MSELLIGLTRRFATWLNHTLRLISTYISPGTCSWSQTTADQLAYSPREPQISLEPDILHLPTRRMRVVVDDRRWRQLYLGVDESTIHCIVSFSSTATGASHYRRSKSSPCFSEGKRGVILSWFRIRRVPLFSIPLGCIPRIPPGYFSTCLSFREVQAAQPSRYQADRESPVNLLFRGIRVSSTGISHMHYARSAAITCDLNHHVQGNQSPTGQ